MEIRRVYAQPSKDTFTIKPIKQIIDKYMMGGKWFDPCAGWNSPAAVTNDLNPSAPTTHHLHAAEFLEGLEGEYDGILFDPPYSLRQMQECYHSIGIEKLRQRDTTSFYGDLRKLATPHIKQAGLAICCGWNSIGFGKKHGFEAIEILLICHGRAHNDTIVTVERKVSQSMILRADKPA